VDELYFGSADVQDCFRRMLTPLRLSVFFCSPPVRARDLGGAGSVVERVLLSEDTLVWPCPSTLPMGFSQSLFLRQGGGEMRSGRCPSLQSVDFLRDRGRPAVAKLGAGASMLIIRHLRHRRLSGGPLLGGALRHLRSLGACDARSRDSEQGRVRFGGAGGWKRMRTSTAQRRFWRVRQGIEYLLRRRRCDGEALEILVGHATFCGLVRRPVLCCSRAACKFIHRRYRERPQLRPSAAEELSAFKGLMPLLVSEWCLGGTSSLQRQTPANRDMVCRPLISHQPL
jgi:hypothetical protein